MGGSSNSHPKTSKQKLPTSDLQISFVFSLRWHLWFLDPHPDPSTRFYDLKKDLKKRNITILVILCDLFGMVKWPFGKVKWPPTRGSKGHKESPGFFFTKKFPIHHWKWRCWTQKMEVWKTIFLSQERLMFVDSSRENFRGLKTHWANWAWKKGHLNGLFSLLYKYVIPKSCSAV